MWFPNKSITNRPRNSHGRWLEAVNFLFRKYRNSTIRVAKIKALISLAVSAHMLSHSRTKCIVLTP